MLPDSQIVLYEAGESVGGKIKTISKDGFLIEEGPDAISSRRPEVRALVQELGIEDQIIWPVSRGFSILRGGKLHFVPPGILKRYPYNLKEIWRSELFSLSAKLKALVLPLLHKQDLNSIDFKQETVRSFFSKQWGAEISLRLFETLYGRIYGGGPASDLALSTLPKSALNLSKKERASQSKPAAPFFSFKHGVQTLTDRLQESLSKVKLLIKTPVEEITKSELGYSVQSGAGVEVFDKVVLCTPPLVTASIVKNLSPDLSHRLGKIPIAPSSLLSLGFCKVKNVKNMAGSGFLLSIDEQSPIKGCTYSSLKWGNRSSLDDLLIRYFVDSSGVGTKETELVSTALLQTERLFGIKQEPRLAHLSSWAEGYPLFDLKHKERITEIQKASLKDFYLAGCYLDGAGIPDCIAQAKKIAQEISLDDTKSV